MKLELPYRNHLSEKEITELNKIKIKQRYKKNQIHCKGNGNLIKPKGFWYSYKNEWFNICKKESYRKNKYVYKVNINKNQFTTIDKPNKNKILLLNSVKDYKKFEKIQKKLNNNLKFKKYIINNFTGLDISPNLFYSKYFKNEYFIFYGWDLPSGVIWDLRIIDIKINKIQKGL